MKYDGTEEREREKSSGANIHDCDPDKEMSEGKKSARALWAKDKIAMPEEARIVMEFWAWQQARGLPRKGETRRIYSHEEILRGDWKAERDGVLE